MKPVSLLAAGANRLRLTAVISAALTTLAFTARAHPGHDLRDATPGHLLTSPDHLAVLALGGFALWLIGRFVQRQLPRRLLQGAGVAAVLTAAAIWGVRT